MSDGTASVEDRLVQLGVELPAVGESPGNFVPCVRSGRLLFISGQVALMDDGTILSGRVGAEISEDEARGYARQAALRILAIARQALGSLEAVSRVVKVNGYVNAVPGFGGHPAVINGCSDLFVELFGERGHHARAAIGAGSLPGNAPVEVEAVLEVGG